MLEDQHMVTSISCTCGKDKLECELHGEMNKRKQFNQIKKAAMAELKEEFRASDGFSFGGIKFIESPISVEQLKLEINNLIWMHGPAALTLREAEEMALKILQMFQEAQEKVNCEERT